MPGLLLLLLLLQFWQIQAALPGIKGARTVAVAVWADPGSSGRDRGCQGCCCSCSLDRSRLLWGRRRNPGPAQAPVAFSVSGLEGGLPGHSGAVPVDPILFANGSSNINSVVPAMAPIVAVGRT